jgi:hypothetical protein
MVSQKSGAKSYKLMKLVGKPWFDTGQEINKSTKKISNQKMD